MSPCLSSFIIGVKRQTEEKKFTEEPFAVSDGEHQGDTKRVNLHDVLSTVCNIHGWIDNVSYRFIISLDRELHKSRYCVLFTIITFRPRPATWSTVEEHTRLLLS